MTLRTIHIQNLQSLVAIIDYSDFRADIDRLKFDLNNLCLQSGSRAIIQDSAHYNIDM
jgi:hypothetical protein